MVSAEGNAGRNHNIKLATIRAGRTGDGLPPFGPECFVFQFAVQTIILSVDGYGWGTWDCHRLRVAQAKGSTG